MKKNLLNPHANGGAGLPFGTAPAPRLPRLATGDLINLSDLTRKEFLALLDLAADLKVHPGRYRDLLSGCGLAMIFEKPSLRTRVTFDVAMQEMGGHAVFLDFSDSPLGEREDIVDVARNLELWMDAIVARTFEHESIELLAQASAVPVINGLSDFSHPCQALADFLTLREEFEDFDGLKLAYVGDGNNTLHSLLEAAALAGISMGVATPAGYEPDAALVARVHQIAKRSGAHIEIGNRTATAVKGASAVYTDTWASMGQEAESTQRARDFAGFQVNEELMKKARPGARFMHCLPAHRGQEVAVGVIDSPVSVVYRQAENRLHAQKAILAALILGNVKERETPKPLSKSL
ncbi:MAG TPA: ornithine carbamoyltransferase [Terriglobales bacterium]|nr:ornithine carbamoyltransferase [Terriglobales bacterium]